MITIDDVKKVEIKIGTILSVEKVPDADKLIRMMIDVGEAEPRQILAGVAEYVTDLTTLVGKQVPIVTNLEPRTLRGFESKGMMLGASGEHGFALLHPAQEVKPGSEVR